MRYRKGRTSGGGIGSAPRLVGPGRVGFVLPAGEVGPARTDSPAPPEPSRRRTRAMLSGLRLDAGMEPYPGYRLVRMIGRGGFAEVWQAEIPDGGTLALKFLACTNSRATPQEIRALQAIRQVRHPNLVHIDRVWGYL